MDSSVPTPIRLLKRLSTAQSRDVSGTGPVVDQSRRGWRESRDRQPEYEYGAVKVFATIKEYTATVVAPGSRCSETIICCLFTE